MRDFGERRFFTNLHPLYDTAGVFVQGAWDCCICTFLGAHALGPRCEVLYEAELVASLPHLRSAFFGNANKTNAM